MAGVLKPSRKEKTRHSFSKRRVLSFVFLFSLDTAVNRCFLLTLLLIGGQLLIIAFLIELSQLSHKFQQNHSRNIKLLCHREMICIRNNS